MKNIAISCCLWVAVAGASCTKSDLGMDDHVEVAPVDISCFSVASKMLDSLSRSGLESLRVRMGGHIPEQAAAAIGSVRHAHRQGLIDACSADEWPDPARQCAMSSTSEISLRGCLHMFGESIHGSVRTRIDSIAADMAAALGESIRRTPAALSIARFHRDNMAECVDIGVTVHPPEGTAMMLSTEQLTVLVADDVFATNRPTDSILGGGAKSQITEALALFVTKDKKAVPKEGLAELNKFSAQFSWPPAQDSAIGPRVTAGELARVDSCLGLQRFAFGTCALSDSSPAVAWSVTWHHYDLRDTVDSDKNMRRCAKVGGRWSAPAKDDPDAARERAFRRAKDMQRLLD